MEDKFLQEMRLKCKAKYKSVNITEKDIQAVYFLWNDPSMSKSKLERELKRSNTTMNKINDFIKKYMTENKLTEMTDEIITKITNAYNNN